MFLPILEESPENRSSNLDSISNYQPWLANSGKDQTIKNASPLSSRSIECHHRTSDRPNRFPLAADDFGVSVDSSRIGCRVPMSPDAQ